MRQTGADAAVDEPQAERKRHGDAGIAFVLAHYASRELNIGPIKVSSRPTRRRSRLTKGY